MNSRTARLALILPLALGLSQTVHTQGYPSKPVRVIVGTVAGGPQDVIARGTASILSQSMGQPFVVEKIGRAHV